MINTKEEEFWICYNKASNRYFCNRNKHKFSLGGTYYELPTYDKSEVEYFDKYPPHRFKTEAAAKKGIEEALLEFHTYNDPVPNKWYDENLKELEGFEPVLVKRKLTTEICI